MQLNSTWQATTIFGKPGSSCLQTYLACHGTITCNTMAATAAAHHASCCDSCPGVGWLLLQTLRTSIGLVSDGQQSATCSVCCSERLCLDIHMSSTNQLFQKVTGEAPNRLWSLQPYCPAVYITPVIARTSKGLQLMQVFWCNGM